MIKLKEIRKEKGLSQQEIADILNLKNRNSISRIELGQAVLNHEQIIKLCQALDIRSDRLLGLINDDDLKE